MIQKRSVPRYLLSDPLNERYCFIKCRELEGTLEQGPELGCWGTTDLRVRFGWGTPSLSAETEAELSVRWPPGSTDHLDPEALPNRIAAYRRVRSARECEAFVSRYSPVLAGFTITRNWLEAETVSSGVIPLDATSPVIGSHGVNFTGVDAEQEMLEFDNTFWSADWGNQGRGLMPFRYFDEHLIEGFTVAGLGAKLIGRSGQPWGTPLNLSGSAHGMIVFNNDNDTLRYAWAFFTEVKETIHVDELYVRPEYRQQGWGSKLWAQLLNLSLMYSKPLTLWIPYADCERDHLEVLGHFFRKRGYALVRSPERWAGAMAVPGPMPAVMPVVSFPPRPSLTMREALRVAGFSVLLASQAQQATDLPDPSSSAMIQNAAPDATSASQTSLQQLERLAQFPAGWNGYGAPAPASIAIQNAKELIRQAESQPFQPTRIEPSAMGGIGVTFGTGEREVVIEFYNHGTAHALFSDDRTEEMHTQPVTTTPEGYQQLFVEIGNHLHGK